VPKIELIHQTNNTKQLNSKELRERNSYRQYYLTPTPFIPLPKERITSNLLTPNLKPVTYFLNNTTVKERESKTRNLQQAQS
jgi:hypothetical protein